MASSGSMAELNENAHGPAACPVLTADGSGLKLRGAEAGLPDPETELVAEKAALLQYYDVPGMDRAVAIVAWGRSGSYLLTSFLDGHSDVIMLPASLGQLAY